ncbi:restriction endonuclease subunit S [Escherichia coli]|nr:type I restriction endonuclease subunit S [Escherichia coli]MBS9159256.1 restriction endonuclease subunit S [Escherichia coli]MBS9176691.1 restriction endonuclease subunit S [Escherichia coli]
MTNLAFPSKWEKVELGDTAVFQNGYAFKSSTYIDAGDFVIRIGNVQDTGINLNNPAYVNASELNAEKFRLSQGDILMSLTGNVGRTALIKEEHLPAVLNQRVAKVILSSLINKKFSFYLLRSNIVQSELLKCAKGAAQLNISTKDLEKIVVGIPSICEQKIIAEKLDTLLAQVDSTKARLEQIPQILKRFRQAVLTYAVNGTLTSEWREINTPDEIDINEISDILFQNKITLGNFGKKTTRADIVTEEEMSLVVQHVDKWKLIRIGEICGCIVPNRDKPKTFSGGYHWLLTQNFAESSIWINYSQIKLGLSPEEIIKYKSRIVPKGNVIMTCVGRVGMSAVLEEDAVINQQLHAFITNDYITPEYLAYCIRANKKFFDKKATSTTINYLNKTACNSLPIPLPCFEEQHEIVRRVEQLFAYADTIEKQVNNALARVNNLTQSILAKAFRGELTAQWRAENPDLISGENSAAALLEKIKAERAASGGKKASRKKS